MGVFHLGDGFVLNSVHLILVVLCYISARGFVHDETFGGRGGFVCHFIELRSSLLHVAVEAPDVAAVPRFKRQLSFSTQLMAYQPIALVTD